MCICMCIKNMYERVEERDGGDKETGKGETKTMSDLALFIARKEEADSSGRTHSRRGHALKHPAAFKAGHDKR